MDREKLLKRIAQLRAMTAERGASEAEAMSAMAKAAALMAEFEVSELEVAALEKRETFSFDMGVSEGVNGTKGKKARHEVIICCLAISKLFECKAVFTNPKIVYIGDAPDRILAEFVTDLIRDAMDRGYADFRRGRVGVSRIAYCQGFATRVIERIDRMIAERNAYRATGGANLPVIVNQKAAAVRAATAVAFPKLSKGRPFGAAGKSNGSYEAGQRAGNRVHLGGGIGGGSATGRIA